MSGTDSAPGSLREMTQRSAPSPSLAGPPGDRYTDEEAGRLIAHAEAILAFCQDLLSTI